MQGTYKPGQDFSPGPEVTPLKVLLLADDRPGHVNLSLGMIKALARLRPVVTTRREVRIRRGLSSWNLSYMLNYGLPASAVLRSGYGISQDDLPAADLVVSSGGNTLAANIAAARLLGASNLFYGSLRRYRAQDFSLVLTSYAESVTDPRIVSWMKPSHLDADDFPIPPDGATQVVGLLVGGPSGEVKFEPQDWRYLCDLIIASNAETGVRWVVSNSRRTPDAASDSLARIAYGSGSPIDVFIDVRKSEPPGLDALFRRAKSIMVTADSSSMLSEAIWLRRPTLAVFPALAALDSKEAQYRKSLREAGWLAEAPLSRLRSQELAPIFASLRPMIQNPADGLAQLFGERLPHLFGPASERPLPRPLR